MRIVIDGRYLDRRPSGIGSYVHALVTRLPVLAPDLEFRVWTGGVGRSEISAKGLDWHLVPQEANGLMTLLAPWLLDRLEPGDLFHAPANVLGFGLPCPSVVTVHDAMWIERPAECQPKPILRPISKNYFRIGIRNALRQARRIVTVSHASARAIERVERAASGKISVVHNGYDPQFEPPKSRTLARQKASRVLGFNDDYLLVVGQNQPSKGHEVALQAFAVANVNRLRLVFVQRLCAGLGLVERVRALGLAERVRFVSQLEDDSFLSVLQSASALLQPSLEEGFGLPALEAAACGCPVIASDIAALREVLGDAATYADTGNVTAWRDAIEHHATGTGVAPVFRSKLQEQAGLFGWDRTARATLDVYRSVIADMTHSLRNGRVQCSTPIATRRISKIPAKSC